MAKINILESSVYNKIAAGEVVERPASALKELIENSIDAGSTVVSIEVEEGGTKKIRVSDNGSGIEPDDIQNAFLCHATSKIRSEQDLESIGTLGFRGEALSSIAAVSHVTLVSKTRSHETATKIVLEAGVVKSVEEMSAPIGTTITVENLFFNVPARIKFLKKAKYEEMDISATVSRLILANPTVAIKLTINGKIVYSSLGRGQSDAIFEVYGKEIFDNIIPVKLISDDMVVEGYVGNKVIAKSNRTFQTLVINGRYVTNFMVSSAVQNACESFLMKGQFPFYVLNLKVPLNSVDVNVHPNKMEVKFENSNKIFSIFNKAVFEALSYSDFVAKPFAPQEANPQRETVKLNNFVFPTEYLQSNARETVDSQKSTISNFVPKNEEIISDNTAFRSSILEMRSPSSVLEEVDVDLVIKEPVIKSEVQNKMFVNSLSFKIIGTVFETFIIVQSNDKMYFIDQHAAHERELFDKIMKEISNQEITKQDMLFPYLREVSREETEFLGNNMEVFEKAGFEIDFFGKNTLRISCVPFVLKDIDLNEFVSAVFANIQTIANKPLDFALRKFATMACRAAVKAGDILTNFEIEALLSKLSEDKVLLCPHGRPIVVEVSKKDIEKWFKRIV